MNTIFPETEERSIAELELVARLKRMNTGYSNAYINSLLPVIEEIRRLKQEKNAVILSHYYMNPVLQIQDSDSGVADFIGDSLGLSIEATRVDADYIIFCGVRFMAETAYILNPGKKVLIPDMDAGCSLASSINAEDVRRLKNKYPGVPVISYINTYAETKAETDICCTSRNAMKIIESFDSDKIIFIPDKYMGRNLKNAMITGFDKEVILWDGCCEVHEQFTNNISNLALSYPNAKILLHWEVPETTVADNLNGHNGVLGSTSDIIRYVGESDSRQFILGSECDLGASLKSMYPDKEFITPCITCVHMKKISLQKTLDALRAIGTDDEKKYEVRLAEELRHRAYLPVKRMLDMS